MGNKTHRGWPRLWGALRAAAILLVLSACTGAGGPLGPGGPLDGDGDGGNYAAGPVSLPTPATLNKNLIVCENIPGPRVECRGSEGAAPPNAHLKLTVYSRFSAVEKKWVDYLIPSAHALVGNTDFCDANAAGAFGQSGDCSVVAAAGEKVGICVAGENNLCSGSELLITVPVEGATASGSSGTIKSLSVDPNGDVIFAKLPKSKPWWKKIDWTGWVIGSAQAQDKVGPSAPLLALSNPVIVPCVAGAPGNSTPYQAPENSTITIKKKNSDGSATSLFRLPGNQEDLTTIFAGNIGNIPYISVALKNTLLIVTPDTHQVLAHLVFPAPIRELGKVAQSNDLSVYLKVPNGVIGLYTVLADSFDASCVNSPEVTSFTIPDSFSDIQGRYPPPPGGSVPISFKVYGGTGYASTSDEYQVIFRQEAVGSIPAWDGVVYRQSTPLKDFEFLYVSEVKVIAAVLDPEANRILLIRRNLVSGDTAVTPISLATVANFPVAMRVIDLFLGNARLLLLDSGEQGAKVLTLPITGLDTGDVSLNLAGQENRDLGAIVANSLEFGGNFTNDWVTYDLVSGNVHRFDPNSF